MNNNMVSFKCDRVSHLLMKTSPVVEISDGSQLCSQIRDNVTYVC